MLRALVAQVSRPVASSSGAASLHTTAVQYAAVKAKSGAAASKQRAINKGSRKAHGRPNVVLGYRPGDEAKWTNCDLAQILVSEEELSRPHVEHDAVVGTVSIPRSLNFGVGAEERKALLETLPALSARVSREQSSGDGTMGTTRIEDPEKLESAELFKIVGFAKLLDLRNANAGGLAYENRRRCVALFSTPSKPHDPGRPEVQAAILTMRIHNLWNHLRTNKRDIGNRRGLRMLVHQRAKILRYLRKYNRRRYDELLPRLGLEPAAVEGELPV
ncbi:hypothetical protein PLICRDRAFT_50284 [Plicaturopsis crispa FD-325 SS-3]|nr:hypothetical protein PLICRDRAFT_50284 [Plicaturopsis crispa FD-325 SS-3]